MFRASWVKIIAFISIRKENPLMLSKSNHPMCCLIRNIAPMSHRWIFINANDFCSETLLFYTLRLMEFWIFQQDIANERFQILIEDVKTQNHSNTFFSYFQGWFFFFSARNCSFLYCSIYKNLIINTRSNLSIYYKRKHF